MHYIVLDLEWNQTYHEKALATQKALSIRLRGEVIQIGAVKLNETLDVVFLLFMMRRRVLVCCYRI